MADLKIGKTNVTQLLKQKYKKLGSGWITLVKVPSKSHLDVNLEALRILESMNYSGIYITVSKGYADILKMLKENNLSASHLYFVDAVSKLYGEKRDQAKNCKFVSGPLNIDAISTAVYETIPEMGSEKKFVFLDSLTAINIYNSLPRTIRFSKFLRDTLKRMGVDGIMVSIAEGTANNELIKELSKICDEVIEISSGGGLKEVK